jgi:hypothetical protein
MPNNIPVNAPPGDGGFKTEQQILELVPVCRRTWGHYKAKGLVPYIKIGRRCLYDWPSVYESLKRHTRGGIQ